MGGKVEEIFLFFACWRQFREVVRIDDHMAGRAGHHAFARAFKRRASRPGDIEKPLAGLSNHFLVEGSVWTEEAH